MRVPLRSRTRRPLGALAGSFVIVALALAGGAALAACSGHDGGSRASWTPMPTMGTSATPTAEAPGGGTMVGHDQAAIAAAWASRPGFVSRQGAATEEAYRYALERGDVLQWMPCYCGCAGMEHRSNLDCFLKPGRSGLPIVFEEHASYCDICIETALMAKRMSAEGRTLAEIRAAVDRTFPVQGVPGTPTELPPT